MTLHAELLQDIQDVLNKRLKGKKIAGKDVPLEVMVKTTTQQDINRMHQLDIATMTKYLSRLCRLELNISDLKLNAKESVKLVTIPTNEEPTMDEQKAGEKLHISRAMFTNGSKKKIKKLIRSSEIEALKNKSYAVKFEGDASHDLQIIHLRDRLSADAIEGKLALALLHMAGKPGGWSKGCEADGRPTTPSFKHWSNRPELTKAWGLSETGSIEKLKVTSNGRGTSLCYKNGEGQAKNFQVR
jgi:hypothetical protein